MTQLNYSNWFHVSVQKLLLFTRSSGSHMELQRVVAQYIFGSVIFFAFCFFYYKDFSAIWARYDLAMCAFLWFTVGCL